MKFSTSGKKLNERPGGVDNIYGNKGKGTADRAEERYFGDSEGKLRHSKYYHDYFRGYTEVRIENPGNRDKPYKVKRIYTAPWIVADMNPGAYFSYCCCYALLALLCAILFVTALTDRAVADNYSPVVAVPGFLSVVALLLFADAGSIGHTLISAAKLAGASASALGVWALERNMSYAEKENNTELPEGEAHRIQ